MKINTIIERTKIKKYYNTIKNEIEILKNNNYTTFKSLHNQLKPLHGHPNNKHLLVDLETKMSELMESQKDNIIHMLIPHKVTSISNNIVISSLNTRFFKVSSILGSTLSILINT